MTIPPQTVVLPKTRRAIFGPAIIVACVVLGPGSILTSSQVGCEFGYDLIWVLLGAGILMLGMVSLAARVGIVAAGSPCSEISRYLGKPFGFLAGISVFLVAACFQFSNNLGVLASLEPLLPAAGTWQGPILVTLNLFLVACLYSLRKLYGPLEKLMVLLVLVMLIAFAANLLMAQPSLAAVLRGFIPQLPPTLQASFLPQLATAPLRILDPWLAVQGLVATTFSMAGAFYQFYLVREKGWGAKDLPQGLFDSFMGTAILIGISLMIMVTSAAVLSGTVAADSLKSVADVALQLEPLFGSAAKWLFCLGVLEGALSSFLVNSMIGGTLLADGMGLDARMDSPWTKRFTVLTLLIGMAMSLMPNPAGRVPLIIFAQAMTVLGGPLLAFSLLYLGIRYRSEGRIAMPRWLLVLAGLGCCVVVLLAGRTAWRLWLTFSL